MSGTVFGFQKMLTSFSLLLSFALEVHGTAFCFREMSPDVRRSQSTCRLVAVFQDNDTVAFHTAGTFQSMTETLASSGDAGGRK